ncbi:MAG: hypothetical protein ACK5IQ_05350 [Bacteroidales bacterium]
MMNLGSNYSAKELFLKLHRHCERSEAICSLLVEIATSPAPRNDV